MNLDQTAGVFEPLMEMTAMGVGLYLMTYHKRPFTILSNWNKGQVNGLIKDKLTRDRSFEDQEVQTWLTEYAAWFHFVSHIHIQLINNISRGN